MRSHNQVVQWHHCIRGQFTKHFREIQVQADIHIHLIERTNRLWINGRIDEHARRRQAALLGEVYNGAVDVLVNAIIISANCNGPRRALHFDCG